jgi:two-component system cell cycle response regulator DivK
LQHSQRVLIVDESAECREVLRTALERNGAETVEAMSAAEGLAAFRMAVPDLIILDLTEDIHERDCSTKLQKEAGQSATPIVILATARLAAADGGVHYVQKPYHFAPLIRRIEGLLSARLQSVS